jgi:hypothetical protein
MPRPKHSWESDFNHQVRSLQCLLAAFEYHMMNSLSVFMFCQLHDFAG